MNFKELINMFEAANYHKDNVLKVGKYPILFTACHTMMQIKEDGSIKNPEVYTKAIALYMHDQYDVNSLIKINDTGIDSNKDVEDEFKKVLINFVKNNQIKLVIDLHGSLKTRDFDVEFGTLNNLSADYSTIKELEDAFVENGIKNIKHNEPFKGGAITKYLYNLKEVDVIQLEINANYRDENSIVNLEKLCNSLGKFINQYIDYQNR